MTIFDYFKTIIVTKKEEEQLDQYVPFLITRWLSFINPTICMCLNVANRQVFLESKELHYKLLISLFPKMKYTPRINYVKKVKQEKHEENKQVRVLAEQFELSTKEIQRLLQAKEELTS